MNRIFFIFFFLIICSNAFAEQGYKVRNSGEFLNSNYGFTDEKVLFILDFSSSMTEQIDGKTKHFLMLNTMRQILPSINPNTYVGLRVYGHRAAVTQYDGCKASALAVPIKPNSAEEISRTLSKVKPRGLTPITYSLKKAVESDFLGFGGKKHIILLTDGGENCDESPCTWAMGLVSKRKDITIDVIAFNIDDDSDLAQLKCTALVTSGKFHSANTAAELVKSLQKTLNITKDVDAKIILPD